MSKNENFDASLTIIIPRYQHLIIPANKAHLWVQIHGYNEVINAKIYIYKYICE